MCHLASDEISYPVWNQQSWHFPSVKCNFFRICTHCWKQKQTNKPIKSQPKPILLPILANMYFILFSITSKHWTSREGAVAFPPAQDEPAHTKWPSVKLPVTMSNMNPGCTRGKGRAAAGARGFWLLQWNKGVELGLQSLRFLSALQEPPTPLSQLIICVWQTVVSLSLFFSEEQEVFSSKAKASSSWAVGPWGCSWVPQAPQASPAAVLAGTCSKLCHHTFHPSA